MSTHNRNDFVSERCKVIYEEVAIITFKAMVSSERFSSKAQSR